MKIWRGKSGNEGSVVLVALCFVAVLGIALASYLAVSNQAMRLSNRSYLSSVSEQLAESGLEQALASFNRNAWDSAIWTFTGMTASRTITFPASKYGNGVTASINLRVDNYNVPASSRPWKASVPNVVNDIVSYDAVSAWRVSSLYVVGDLVQINGLNYRCIVNHAGQTPPNATYWQVTTAKNYRAWYRCKTANSGQPPPDDNYWTPLPIVVYSEGVTVPPDGVGSSSKTQLRATISIAPLFPNAVGANLSLNFSASGQVDSYDGRSDPDANLPGASAVLAADGTANPSVTVVSANVKGYVATRSTTAFPSLTSFGGSASLKNGVVISPHPSAANVDLTRISRSPSVPRFDPSVWDVSAGYLPGDIVRYSGDLYVCKLAHTNQTPGNTAYWTANTSLDYATITTTPLGIVGAILPANYVYNGDLDLNGDTITVKGPIVLDVRGYLRTRNGGQIIIENTGQTEIQFSGRLWIGSSSAPALGIKNETKDPRKLLLFGSVSGTFGTNRYWSSDPLYGTIYMPNITSALNISSPVFGAVSANSVSFPISTNLHYDTSLLATTYRSMETAYAILEWRELTDQAERVTLP